MFIVSPHIDDAFFSMGLTIDEALSCGSSVVIINCFTVSDFTLDKKEADISAITKLRKGEDMLLLTRYKKLKFTNLDFLDAPLRGEEIKQNFPLNSKSTQIALEIEQLLIELVPYGHAIYFPLSIGNHIDHLICTAVGLALFNTGKYNIHFYEDLPYVLKFSVEHFDEKIKWIQNAAGDELTCEKNLFKNCALKKELIEGYASQLNTQMLQSIINYAIDSGGEKIWSVKNH